MSLLSVLIFANKIWVPTDTWVSDGVAAKMNFIDIKNLAIKVAD